MFLSRMTRPLRRAAETAAAAGAIPSKLKLNFAVPHEQVFRDAEVDQVLVPGRAGMFGVLPGHVPTIAELSPGVVSVFNGDTRDNFFISSGFAFVHAECADICAVEAVKIADLDPSAVSKGVEEFQQKVASAQNDEEKALAEAGLEVYTAMQSAVDEYGKN